MPEKKKVKQDDFITIYNQKVTDMDIAEFYKGNFPLKGGYFKFENFPINWQDDPYDNRSWCMYLHSLVFLEVLFKAYLKDNNLKHLVFAKNIAIDWIRQNQLEADNISQFAWYDMAIAYRAANISFLIKVNRQKKFLTNEEYKEIINSLIVHGKYLEDDRNYAWKHNHGLYSDAGLYLLADQVAELPNSNSWLDKARTRFLETTKDTFTYESVHKEHSPFYHVNVTNILNRLSTIFEKRLSCVDEINKILFKAKQVSYWLIMPDNKYPQLGDTHFIQGPSSSWMNQVSQKTDYQVFMEAGYAICKQPESYLIFTCGYHSQAHKQSDELTFSLYDFKERIIVDTGVYGYYYSDPGRIYAVSSKAHNTLTVNGQNFNWKTKRPYGSGINGGYKKNNWFIFWGNNPLIEEQGITHNRVIFYRPKEILLVVDLVINTDEEMKKYERYWHFAPHIKVEKQSDSILNITGDNFKGILKNFNDDSTTTSVVRGQKEPFIQGFTFPENRVWVENSVAVLETETEKKKVSHLVTALVMQDKGFWYEAKLKNVKIDELDFQLTFRNQTGKEILLRKEAG